MHYLISEFLNCNTERDIVHWYHLYINPDAYIYFLTDEQKIIDILSQNPD
jgi:spore germination protein YaaH